ncbi:MAG: DNA-binding protein [Pedobacter sp.]|nr:MAG: DNA-binding protein [Pedobacter sp.]
MGPHDLITKEDLEKFRALLLEDIRQIFQGNGTGPVAKKWLKSADVRKLLQISPGTLQNLRINGTLAYTKIGGTMFYRLNDIEKMLNRNPDSGSSTIG